MDADWTINQRDWRLMSRCNAAAEQAFPHDAITRDSLALHWYNRCQKTGESPQTLLEERCPNINNANVQKRIIKFRKGY